MFMRYFELYDSREYSTTRSTKIDLEQANHIILTECNEIINKPPIYRGTTFDSAAILSDPVGKQRQSANTESYINLLIDNMPNWQQYPKRSDALICTTDFNYAVGYGTTYRVFPYNGSKIGICSNNDLWTSFEHISVSRFNESLKYAYHALLNVELPENNTIYDNIAELSSALIHPKIAESDWRTKDAIGYLQRLINETNSKNLIDFVNNYVDPIVQNFTLTDTSNFDVTDRREIWFSSKAILINVNTLSDLVFD